MHEAQEKTVELPQDGLWAYFEGRFYALSLEGRNRKTDHVTWFRAINLPDYGPDFDRILRGRMVWDRHFDYYVLTFYGARHLPNQIYEMVTRRFNANGARVVERPASEHWR